MDHDRFDDLTIALASGVSRREALRTISSGVIGAALASFLPRRAAAAPKSSCAAFCQQLAASDARGQCVRDAARGTGLCYQCGPLATGSSQTLCGNTCADTSTDPNNCGACGTTCSTTVANATAVCVGSTCTFACNDGFVPCNGQCVPECLPGLVLDDDCACVCPANTDFCGGVRPVCSATNDNFAA